MNGSQPHGVLVEFISAEQLLGAVWRVRREQPNCAIEAYSPFAVEGLDEALGCRHDGVAPWTLLGADEFDQHAVGLAPVHFDSPSPLPTSLRSSNIEATGSRRTNNRNIKRNSPTEPARNAISQTVG